MRVLNLCGGPGGWDVFDRDLGLETDSVEIDPVVRATAEAAGLKHVHDDVRTFELDWHSPYVGLKASPVCTPFTPAGKRSGIDDLGKILRSVRQMGKGQPPLPEASFADPNTSLVLEPLRIIFDAWKLDRPFQWVVMEQAASVLPIWEEVGTVMRRRCGYDYMAGVIPSYRFGVPQNRRRAVLVARLGDLAWLPGRTAPDVTMLEAIGRGSPW